MLNLVKEKEVVTPVSTYDTELVSFANDINKMCPYMIDKETRLDNVNPFMIMDFNLIIHL